MTKDDSVRCKFLLAQIMRSILAILFSIAALLARPSMAAETPKNLTVLTDVNLALPLTRIARDYARERGVTITVVITDGRDAAQQIGQGLDANLLITANQLLLESLTERGLIDAFNKHTVASTQLALAAPVDVARRSNLAKHISFTTILFAQPDLPLLVLPESTLEGAHTQTLLANPDYSDSLHSRVMEVDSRDAMIERLAKQSGFGLLFAADIAQEPSLKLLTLLPTNAVGIVHYQAVLIASEAMEASRELLRYLQSPMAQQVFAKAGFQ
jgi:molybdenum ABC transporter molybdate-binding protein